MKFMKLGTRPDIFYTVKAVRSVSIEVSCDLIIQVQGSKYLLHKFPLLSKSALLRKLCSETREPESVIELPDFPSGIEAFEVCAKFCYGITVTLSAFNIVAVLCAAEYLQMTEDVEKGNLIYKLDIFLNSCILHGWKDSITTLQTTKAFPLWSKHLGITGRCIDAIATRVIAHPSRLNWSNSLPRGTSEETPFNGTESQKKQPASKGWWAEAIAELGIDHYWRIMVALKAAGKVSASLVGEALQVYALRRLPNFLEDCNNNVEAIRSFSDSMGERSSKHRLIVESIVSLLPFENGCVSCSFLFKLLKAANIFGASSSSKMELARRVGLQLEEATVSDLLIPSLSQANDTLYDVDLVTTILEQFMLSQGETPPTSPPRERLRARQRRSRSAENVDFEFQERRSSSASHSSKLVVAKLIDSYLQEIARDSNLPLEKLIALADAIPDFARQDHNDLYRVIDTYLKAHPDLNKSQRKRLCGILDCKKLSMEACMHAAQNELLPLRVVVQVLFLEQARGAMAGGGQATGLPNHLGVFLSTHEEKDASRTPQARGSVSPMVNGYGWKVPFLKSTPKPKHSTLRMKLAEAESDLEEVNNPGGDVPGRTASKLKSFGSNIPANPKKMLRRLCSINRSKNAIFTTA